MARLGFCGLGAMGAPMAERLVRAGHDVVVWNRTRSKAEPLVGFGAALADTPSDAAHGAEGVCTMLSTPEAVEEVVLGAEGVASGMGEGATLIEMSTIGPEAVRAIAARLGRDLLDAPVLGSTPEAREGRLKVFVGGPEARCRRWFPVLEAMGSPRRMGELGAGASMKLVVNSTLMVLQTGLGEAMALSDCLGLDQGATLDVLSEAAIGVTARSKRAHLETGEFPPHFTLALARKDSALVVETAERCGTDVRLARAARGWLEQAEEAGLGEMDYSAVIARIRGKDARLP